MRFLKRRQSNKKDDSLTSNSRRPSLFGSRRRRKAGSKTVHDRFAETFKSGPLETPEGVKDASIADLKSQRFKSERTLGPIVEEASTDASSAEGTEEDTDVIIETLVDEQTASVSREKPLNNYFCGCFDFNFGDS